ncbi:MAG: type II toxin-antitoxin system RelE/ParE family toxin, partial [Bacilli bacterium]|nr:type II toxin-antitoxin system RelE/ParE family toxin [Bacilli bacterium]
NVLIAAQYRHIEHTIKEAIDFNYLSSIFEIKMLDPKTKLYELKFQKIRVIHFIYTNNTFVYLGTFIKKTGQTPKQEIEKNTKRIQEFEGLKNETDTHNR